jgi:hypothetical protein
MGISTAALIRPRWRDRNFFLGSGATPIGVGIAALVRGGRLAGAAAAVGVGITALLRPDGGEGAPEASENVEEVDLGRGSARHCPGGCAQRGSDQENEKDTDKTASGHVWLLSKEASSRLAAVGHGGASATWIVPRAR